MGGASRRIYPKANTTAQWYETLFSRGTFTRIEKVLLHTTETTGWPGYKSGASAPTLTYHCRRREWRQHNYLDRSARALVDPDSTPVRENRDNVIQIEIIAYADEPKGRSVGGLEVSKLTDDNLRDLGEFIGWVHQQWGLPLVAAKFIAYPGSYGNSSVRMSSSTYDAFRGVLGHQHASGNSHGDPGALNVARIMQHAAAYVGGSTPTPAPVQEDVMATLAEVTTALKNLLVNDADVKRSIAIAVLGYKNTAVDSGDVFQNIIDAGNAKPATVDVAALASEIVTRLPAGVLTKDDVEASLRKVLGSVDNEPSAT